MYASVGAVAELGTEATWNQALLGIEPDRAVANARFLRYWLEHLRPTLTQLARSNTQSNLNAEQVGNLPFPMVPLRSQELVADYLDTETARIDALIDKKQRLQDSLDHRWVATLYAALRGAREPGPRRDSGLDWLADIPADWGTPSIGQRFDVQLGKMLNGAAREGPNQLPYLRNQNVQWDRVDTADVHHMHFDPDELGRFRVQPGDLLVCEGGDVGRAAVWSGSDTVYYQKALHRLRPLQGDEPRFLMYVLWLASELGVFENQGNQSTIVHLTREQLREQRFPLPTLGEQRLIVSMLDRERDRQRELSLRHGQQTSLLLEHRQAVITAAVTGELEIPGVAA